MTLLNQCIQTTNVRYELATNIQNSSLRREECSRGSRLSPTLFNIYIKWISGAVEQSTAPGLTLQDKNIKFLLYADDLVLLSSTPQGLQQHLDLLENYLPELGPGGKPQKDQHYGLSEKAQMSGTQIPVQSRQHRSRTHEAVHLPRPDHHCIGEFQYGSDALKDKLEELYTQSRKIPKYWNTNSNLV